MRGITSEPTLTILDFGSPVITTNALAVTWNTNLPASSYVIYSAEGEPHELDISNTFGNPPTYGYAHATPEINIDPKVTSHIVVVTGLQPLTTYYFRAVSRGSLVISPEYKVTLPAVAGTATVAEGVEGGTTTSESGKSSSETGTTQEELTTTENTEEGNLSTGEETNLLQTEENSGGEQSNISTETPNPFVAGFAFVANHYLWLVLIVLVIIAVGYFIYYSINKKK